MLADPEVASQHFLLRVQIVDRGVDQVSPGLFILHPVLRADHPVTLRAHHLDVGLLLELFGPLPRGFEGFVAVVTPGIRTHLVFRITLRFIMKTEFLAFEQMTADEGRRRRAVRLALDFLVRQAQAVSAAGV